MLNGLCAVALVTGALFITSCGQSSQTTQTSAPAIRVDGSSTVFPLTESVAEAFMLDNRGRVRVTVGESGTGGGFRRFCRGETEVQGASRPILTSEIEACQAAGIGFVELPIAFDGLTVVVNLQNPLSTITMAELKKIWEPSAEGKITNWRHVNPAWRDGALQLFGAGTASGTFDFFTEAVVGKAKSSRTDYTPTEDDNVTVQGVINNAGAMGYFGVAYFREHAERLKALSIDAGAGPVAPTEETIASGKYPLSRPLFVYVSVEALRRPMVQQFVSYMMTNTERLALQVGYIPLPAEAYRKLAERASARQAGTAFGGEQDVGGSIEEVLSRPLVQSAPPSTGP